MLIDRLSALDEAFLRIESDAAHMHVGWTLLVEGEPPTIDELCEQVAARLDLLPRFRRCAVTSPMHLHDPVWVDDPEFDVANHVARVSLSAPGELDQLHALAGRVMSRPLNRRRPLWKLHLVDGLCGGFAIVGRAHHALVDGVAAVEVAQLLLDGVPAVTDTLPSRWTPAPAPPLHRRTLDTIAERARVGRTAARAALRALENPATVRAGANVVRRISSALSPIASAAPATALNRPIGPKRATAFAELSLPAAKAVGRRRGATVNDVVLATAALALGRCLRRCGESPPWLRTLVPVSTRANGAGAELGNQLSVVFVELPVGERSPTAALDEVTRQMREHKRGGGMAALDGLLRAARFAPLPIRDLVSWIATRPQTFNAIVSNIPGPREPLYLLGRPVRAAYPAVPLVRGHGLSVGILSYRDVLHVGLYADPEVVCDLDEIARDFTRSFDALRFSLAPRAPEPPELVPEPAEPAPALV